MMVVKTLDAFCIRFESCGVLTTEILARFLNIHYIQNTKNQFH